MVEGFAVGAAAHCAPLGGESSNQSPFHSVRGAAQASWAVLTSPHRWRCLGESGGPGLCEDGRKGGQCAEAEE